MPELLANISAVRFLRVAHFFYSRSSPLLPLNFVLSPLAYLVPRSSAALPFFARIYYLYSRKYVGASRPSSFASHRECARNIEAHVLHVSCDPQGWTRPGKTCLVHQISRGSARVIIRLSRGAAIARARADVVDSVKSIRLFDVRQVKIKRKTKRKKGQKERKKETRKEERTYATRNRARHEGSLLSRSRKRDNKSALTPIINSQIAPISFAATHAAHIDR